MAYSEYNSTFPDENGKSFGNTLILCSDNKLGIASAIVKYKEDGVMQEKTYEIDRKKPFVIKIDRLGSPKGISREIISYEFFDSKGKRIDQLFDKNKNVNVIMNALKKKDYKAK